MHDEATHEAETLDDRPATNPPSGDTTSEETVVEAILFASDIPLAPAKIATAAELPPRRIQQAVQELNRRYEQMGCAFRIEEVAGGFQMLTRPEYHDVLKRLLNVKKDSRLSQAGLETLAIVAYRQPILRVDVEAIRGVACGEVLRTLMERNLVKIVGRAEVIGRPMLYGTTKHFLEVFGLASLDDLPRVEELRSGAEDGRKPKPDAETTENPEEGEPPVAQNDEEPQEEDEKDEEFDEEDSDDENSEDEEEEEEEDDDE